MLHQDNGQPSRNLSNGSRSETTSRKVSGQEYRKASGCYAEGLEGRVPAAYKSTTLRPYHPILFRQ